MNQQSLLDALKLLSTHTRLLVASDFDGTISKFTENFTEAVLDPIARTALRKLSEFPNTYVAIISGRSLGDLTEKFSEVEKARLVGSHGHEFDIDKIAALTEEQRRDYASAEAIIKQMVQVTPGTSIEKKPHGLVYHFRGATKPAQNQLDTLTQELQKIGSGLVRQGSSIVEYSVVTTHKGDALRRIQEQLGPTITLFIGDDITDEGAFTHLDPSDVSIKVGSGQSAARFRVDTCEDAIRLLAQLSELRNEWIRTLPAVPIDNHLFLSDQRAMALVDTNGTVSWLCTPRIDSAPLFGALVGGPGSGHFRISGLGEGKQQYFGNTLIGVTSFKDVSVTDYIDCSAGRTYQRAGRSDLIRLIEGSGDIDLEFAPKFNFGRVPTKLSRIQNGLRIECGEQRLVLYSAQINWEVSKEGKHDVARFRMKLQNECVPLVLLIGTASADFPSWSITKTINETQKFWESWVATLKIPQNYPSLVTRSAVILRGLVYGPTGAIAAAATSSLPETLGSERNWDYRYCWPRDASFAASALLRLGAPGPALRFLDWILGVVFDSESDRFLAPLYTVTGRSVPSEAEVPEALGYRGSRPVRIGNLASEQLQLDALGPIAELMAELARRGSILTEEHRQLAERFVDLVNSRWTMADSGIWEVRGDQRHFVHSKLMCWYTVKCCAEVSRYLGVERKDWEELALQIRTQIETRGFSESLNSYITAYDLPEPDAALLWIILTGFHVPEHPRCLGTLEYIMKNLVHDGGVFRYHFDDSLHGQEGEFVICRCWLIESLAKVGRHFEAQQFFNDLIARISSLGILSEEWDMKRQCALGNYPQAYSHIGLINAAYTLAANFK